MKKTDNGPKTEAEARKKSNGGIWFVLAFLVGAAIIESYNEDLVWIFLAGAGFFFVIWLNSFIMNIGYVKGYQDGHSDGLIDAGQIAPWSALSEETD